MTGKVKELNEPNKGKSTARNPKISQEDLKKLMEYPDLLNVLARDQNISQEDLKKLIEYPDLYLLLKALRVSKSYDELYEQDKSMVEKGRHLNK